MINCGLPGSILEIAFAFDLGELQHGWRKEPFLLIFHLQLCFSICLLLKKRVWYAVSDMLSIKSEFLLLILPCRESFFLQSVFQMGRGSLCERETDRETAFQYCQAASVQICVYFELLEDSSRCQAQNLL